MTVIPALLDITHLREITDGEPTLESALLSHFDATARRCLVQLRSATPAEWGTILHELKGAAASIGANRLAARCADGEAVFPSPSKQLEYLSELTDLASHTIEAFGKLSGARHTG